LFGPRERAFKQFKCSPPQCVNTVGGPTESASFRLQHVTSYFMMCTLSNLFAVALINSREKLHEIYSYVTLQASPGEVFEGAQCVIKEGAN